MVEQVLGDWNSFEFRMIQPSDHSTVLLHMRENFYRDEPLCRHSGYEDELADDLDLFILDALKYNMSFMAVDKSNGRIAGVRLNTIVRKGEHSELPPMKHPKTKPMVDVNIVLNEQADIFSKYPEIDKLAEFFCVSVDKNYRGHGLATEMYDRAFKMLTAMKFPLVKCVFSSPYTQKIARKRGFKEIVRIKFLDCKNESGERYFPSATQDEYASLMVKEI